MTPAEHVLRRVIPEPNSGCWIWMQTLSETGYGRVVAPGGQRSMPAHRWVYQLLRGPIPPGLHLDHLCRVRCCVNPAHLEPVTAAENTRRMLAANGNFRLCRHGYRFHQEDLARTYVQRCGECRVDADYIKRFKRDPRKKRRTPAGRGEVVARVRKCLNKSA